MFHAEDQSFIWPVERPVEIEKVLLAHVLVVG